MPNLRIPAAVAALAAAVSVAGCNTATTTGAVGGATAGAVVGGPVGAAVGGVAGAAVGGALSAEESTRFRDYAVAQPRASVTLREEVAVGYRVPRRVALYPVPPSVGLGSQYRYTVINSRPVLVEPATREVVYIVE